MSLCLFFGWRGAGSGKGGRRGWSWWRKRRRVVFWCWLHSWCVHICALCVCVCVCVQRCVGVWVDGCVGGCIGWLSILYVVALPAISEMPKCACVVVGNRVGGGVIMMMRYVLCVCVCCLLRNPPKNNTNDLSCNDRQKGNKQSYHMRLASMESTRTQPASE